MLVVPRTQVLSGAPSTSGVDAAGVDFIGTVGSWARIARETPSAVLLPLRGLLAYAAMSLVFVFRLGYQGSGTSGRKCVHVYHPRKA